MTALSYVPCKVNIVKVNPRIADIVESYLEHRRQGVGELYVALDDGEFEQIQSVAHDLIGSGASFGFEGMSLIGRSLETAVMERQAGEIKELIEGLAEYLAGVELVQG